MSESASTQDSYDSSAVNSCASSGDDELIQVMYNLFTDSNGTNIVEALLSLKKSVDKHTEEIESVKKQATKSSARVAEKAPTKR